MTGMHGGRLGNCEITFSFEIGKASVLDQYVTFV